MISGNHNYGNGYISLAALDLGDLPEQIEVNGYKLLLKSEFHISIACVKRLAPIIDKKRADQIAEEIVKSFLDFIANTPMNKYELTHEYRLVRRDERVTVVAMVMMPGLEQFFTYLEDKYKTKLPLQPAHITMYTLQPDTGIGILSKKQLESDSTPVEVPFKL